MRNPLPSKRWQIHTTSDCDFFTLYKMQGQSGKVWQYIYRKRRFHCGAADRDYLTQSFSQSLMPVNFWTMSFPFSWLFLCAHPLNYSFLSLQSYSGLGIFSYSLKSAVKSKCLGLALQVLQLPQMLEWVEVESRGNYSGSWGPILRDIQGEAWQDSGWGCPCLL